MSNEKKVSLDEFIDNKPFHWKVEFNDILENGGFDVIVGNPPYGNILKDTEKRLLKNIYKSTKSEIAALFVERSIKILNDDGEFGYIITYAITFRKDFSKTRKIIHENFAQCYISSFDRDKCRFFEGVSQSVSLLLCHKKSDNVHCEFFTSKMFRITPELDNINYQKANNYLLGKDIGSSFKESHRLPKIGDLYTLKIMDKLLNYDKKVKDVVNTGSSSNIWIRTSGNYWYNSWDKKPYNSTEIKSIDLSEGFSSIIISIMNSSIFYLWLRVYGDGRHMNIDIMNLFPLIENSTEFKYLFKINSDRLMKYLFLNFDKDKGRFSTSKVKPIIDISDIFIGKLYGLNNEEIDHILNYESVIRGGKTVPDMFYTLFDYLIFLNQYDKKNTVFIECIEFINKLIDLLAEEIYSKNENIYYLVEKNLMKMEQNATNATNLEIIRNFVNIIENSN